MKNIQECSGRWHCTSSFAGQTRLETMSLVFDDNKVGGPGTDDSGCFSYCGHVVGDDVILLEKKYFVLREEDPGVIECSGVWDGEQIRGTWHLRSRPWVAGKFDLWPVATLLASTSEP